MKREHIRNLGNDLWCLDSWWKWQELEVNGVPPCPRRGHSAVVMGSCMYIFGGLYGFSKYLNDLCVYDGETNSWSKARIVGALKPPPRAWHSCTVIGNGNSAHWKQMLVFGGTAGRCVFFNDVWIFDAHSMSWFEVESKRSVFVGCVCVCCVYVYAV